MKHIQSRCKGTKGFTLVEVIVVLVILAILAALLIPSMTGWIDKANDKSVVVEARSALLAAQTLYSEAYADGTAANVLTADIQALADVDGWCEVSLDRDSYQITRFVYHATNGKNATYENGAWTVS